MNDRQIKKALRKLYPIYSSITRDELEEFIKENYHGNSEEAKWGREFARKLWQIAQEEKRKLDEKFGS